MKKHVVSKKISVQIIAAIAVSFLVSMCIATILSYNLIHNYNEGNISPFFSNAASVLIFIAFIVGFILLFLILISKRVVYIKHISEQVNKIAKDELGLTLEVIGNDELAELCRNINYMSKDLKDKFEHEKEIKYTKNELITNVSKDLRAPLTTIIEYLDILKNKKYKSEEEKKEYLISAYKLSIKLKILINELFEYTKFSSNSAVLDFKEVNLGAILIQMLGEYTILFETRGLRIVSNIEEEIQVKIDIEKIVKVFDNILNNMEEYGYNACDLIIKTEKKKDTVHISISNKGIYIKQNELNKQFDNFNEVDILRTSNVKDNDLKLAISKKILELHNGQIWTKYHGDVRTIHIELPISKKCS